MEMHNYSNFTKNDDFINLKVK